MQNIIGTWKAFGTKDANGNFKKGGAPVSLIFEEGGTGKMKLFLFKFPIAWEIRDDQLIVKNVKDDTEIPMQMEEDGTIAVINEDKSMAIMKKQ